MKDPGLVQGHIPLFRGYIGLSGCLQKKTPLEESRKASFLFEIHLRLSTALRIREAEELSL